MTMRFPAIISVNHITTSRSYAKGKPRTRPLTYVPWRLQEACYNIKETLSQPYEQMIPKNQVKRTSESNPMNHTLADIGKFYTIPETFVRTNFALGEFPKGYENMANAFNETCIMIRKPALEIIDYMKRANYSKLPVKYLLYGQEGTGKSITLINLIHYAIMNKFIVLHVPIASYLHKWNRRAGALSETKEGLVDLPLEGAVLLKRFQLQNEEIVTQLQLKTTKEYVWNMRESLPVGSPLMSLVFHGINRVKYSCDALDALINELKQSATSNRCKVFAAINGFNAFYSGKTMVRMNDSYGTTTNQLTVLHSFLSLFKPDWCNGAILTSVCEKTTLPQYRGSYMPFAMLRREGFEEIDPFLPVYVPEFSELEFHNFLDYFEDRGYLQKPGGREEIEFLTSRKAKYVRDYCNAL